MNLSFNSPVFKYLRFMTMEGKYGYLWLDWNRDSLDSCKIFSDLIKVTLFNGLFFSVLSLLLGAGVGYTLSIHAIALYEGIWWSMLFHPIETLYATVISVTTAMVVIFAVGLSVISFFVYLSHREKSLMPSVWYDFKEIASAKLNRFCARVEVEDLDEHNPYAKRKE